MAAAALGHVALWSSSRGACQPVYGPPNRGESSSGPSSEPNADGYVGLVNQGATCYLSSVLQALYMTPDFRRALYDAGAAEAATLAAAGGGAAAPSDGSIVRQLQRLFVSLQTSEAQAIDTKELTHSFGWDASDAFTQHDVQELLRVLFDALETELDSTSQAGALQSIYRGTWSDYVQCKVCLHQSSNPSSFDDINLAIRAFDEKQTPFTSLGSALTAFLEPETLEGDNAYYCEACACKRPALKGTRLVTLPPVLCVGLKRFDFDFASLSRVKLHHPVNIPPVLDMAPYLDGGAIAKEHRTTKRKLIGATTPNATPNTQPAVAPTDDLPPLSPLPPIAPAAVPGAQPAGGIEAMSLDPPHAPGSSASAAMPAAPISGGHGSASAEMPYELFSLLMHSGSALAGHYFAYIRELHSGKWYKFNDSDVTAATDEQLEAAMGGTTGGPSTYMLFYRRVGAEAGGARPPTAADSSAAANAMVTDDTETAAAEVQSSLRVSVPPGLRELLEATASRTPQAVDPASTASTAMQATAPSEGEATTDTTNSFIGPRAPPSSPHNTCRRVMNGADAAKGGLDLAPPAEDDTNAAATATAANDSNPVAAAVSASVKAAFGKFAKPTCTPTKPAARSEPGLVIGRRGPPAAPS